MPRLHLVADIARDIGIGEAAGFLGHARVEDDLEQQVAKLSAQIVHVAAFDRIGDLIRFLDCIRRNDREILRRVPFAPGLRIAQACHDGEESVGLLGHGQDLPPRGSNRKGSSGGFHGKNVSVIIHIMLN